MKEFLAKHTEEISGTVLAWIAVILNIQHRELPEVDQIDWTHILFIPLMSGLVGGFGALIAKLIWRAIGRAYKNWRDNTNKIV